MSLDDLSTVGRRKSKRRSIDEKRGASHEMTMHRKIMQHNTRHCNDTKRGASHEMTLHS